MVGSGLVGPSAALRVGVVSPADLAELHATSKRIGRAGWGIALGGMVYGAINVTELLIAHEVHWLIAPFLSVMVDLGCASGCGASGSCIGTGSEIGRLVCCGGRLCS